MYFHDYEQPLEDVELPGLIFQIPKQKIKVLCMNSLQIYVTDLVWARWNGYKGPKWMSEASKASVSDSSSTQKLMISMRCCPSLSVSPQPREPWWGLCWAHAPGPGVKVGSSSHDALCRAAMNMQCPSSHCGHQRTGQVVAAIWDSLALAISNFQEPLQRGVDLPSLPLFLSVPWGCSSILIIYGHLHLKWLWALPSPVSMSTSISNAHEPLHLQSPWALPSNSWLLVHAAAARVEQLPPDLPEVLPTSDRPSPASRKIEREIWMFYQRKNKPGWALRCIHREVLLILFEIRKFPGTANAHHFIKCFTTWLHSWKCHCTVLCLGGNSSLKKIPAWLCSYFFVWFIDF